MSSFEPNAVIRGFQLTVVGSMSPYMFCCYFPVIQGGIGLKRSVGFLTTQEIPSMSPGLYSIGVGSCQDFDQVLNSASHLLSFALEWSPEWAMCFGYLLTDGVQLFVH